MYELIGIVLLRVFINDLNQFLRGSTSHSDVRPEIQ